MRIRFLGLKIDPDRLGHFKQQSFYHKCQSAIVKNLIAFLGLIQSHGKSRAASSAGIRHNSYGRSFTSSGEKRLCHLFCFF